jgi:hypothetical protein
MISLIKSVRFYLVLILLTNLGLLLPPLRFTASLALIGFLPGYLIVERLALWKDPLFAAVGSLGISFLISPLIVLPGCIIFHQVNAWIIACSLNLFLFGMVYLLRGRERIYYQEKDHSPWLPPMMVLVCGWVFVYLDITALGPYCSVAALKVPMGLLVFLCPHTSTGRPFCLEGIGMGFGLLEFHIYGGGLYDPLSGHQRPCNRIVGYPNVCHRTPF